MFQPRKSFDLTDLNTLGVNSKAEYFFAFRTVKELQEALHWARQGDVTLSILGGGSNALLDKEISGLVLKATIPEKRVLKQHGEHVYIEVGAGENWHELTQWSLRRGFFGLENLSLIPGTVGASPIQNIGAYGVEIGSLIEYVTVLDIRSGEQIQLDNMACRFQYRDSVFKHEEGRYFIVLRVCFRLTTQALVNLTYPSLVQYFEKKSLENPTPYQVSEAIIKIRGSKLPSPSELPNVGSFFKNPLIASDELEKMLIKYPTMPYFEHLDGFFKLAAAWLIDTAGWKGKTINGVTVHSQQALVIINPEKKALDTVLYFSEAIQKDVYDKFKVWLEVEPQKLARLRLRPS